MKTLKKIIRNNWILNLIPRFIISTRYYNLKYIQIIKWLFTSKEDTNFTYELTDSNWKLLTQTIASVLAVPYHEVKTYINEIRNDKEVADYVEKATKQSHYSQNADKHFRIHKRAGWYAFVRIMKPKLVVETGVDKGLGTITLCAALLKNEEEGFQGKYIGTDINPEAGYLLGGKYSSVGKIIIGDSIDSLKNIEEDVELFINDSDHSEEYEWREYLTIKSKLNENSIILGDNSHVTDKLLEFSIQNQRQFQFFKEEPYNHWYPGGGIGISYNFKKK